MKKLYQQQLAFLKSDKTCSPAEVQEIIDAGYARTSKTHFVRVINFNAEELENTLAHFDSPVTLNDWAMDVHDYGCKGRPEARPVPASEGSNPPTSDAPQAVR